MLGNFLELSVWTRDIAASVAFWEPLGFRHGRVGDTWRHRYAVLSDGRLVLGLHEYEFDSPSLTWVRPGIADAVGVLAAQGIEFEFAKTGADQFNEAGFRDPAGQMVTLLEARTWSPVFDEGGRPPLLGHFLEYRYPASSPGEVAAFWARLGLILDETPEGPRVVASGINLAPRGGLRTPELVFETEHPDTTARLLGDRGYMTEPGGAGSRLLRAPDGLAIRITSPPAGSR